MGQQKFPSINPRKMLRIFFPVCSLYFLAQLIFTQYEIGTLSTLPVISTLPRTIQVIFCSSFSHCKNNITTYYLLMPSYIQIDCHNGIICPSVYFSLYSHAIDKKQNKTKKQPKNHNYLHCLCYNDKSKWSIFVLVSRNSGTSWTSKLKHHNVCSKHYAQ